MKWLVTILSFAAGVTLSFVVAKICSVYPNEWWTFFACFWLALSSVAFVGLTICLGVTAALKGVD